MMKNKDFQKIKKTVFSFIALTAFNLLLPAQNLYFEEPVAVTEKNTQFPVVVSGSGTNFVFFEEALNSQIFIKFIEKKDFSEKWSSPKKVAGPFVFSGEVPDIYSAASLSDGTVCVAASESQYEVGIYTSKDGGENFSKTKVSMFSRHLVAPRIFRTKNDAFVLFASLEEENKFSIVYSVSKDGLFWSDFLIFEPAKTLDNSFSPYLCPVSEGDLVVFQSHFSVPDKPKTFQLYSTFSADGLKTFSQPQLLTDDNATFSRRANSFIGFSNQSPVVYSKNSQIWCAWERNEVRSENTYISLARITSDGKLFENRRVREYSDLKNSHRPAFFEYDGQTSLVWFDGNNGAYSAVKNSENSFGSQKFIKNSENSSFVCPVISSSSLKNEISYIWQKNNKNPQIFAVEQDHFVLPPVLKAVNFKKNVRSSQEKVKIRITMPQDTSGISGFSWSFSKSPETEPSTDSSDLIVEKNISSGRSYTVSAVADEDGEYFFKAKVLDAAGNWSESSQISYYRDITPPQKVSIFPVKKDVFGFVNDGSFSVFWQKNQDDTDVAGYSWTFSKVRDLSPQFKDSLIRNQRQNQQKKEEIFEYLQKIEGQSQKLIQKSQKPSKTVGLRKNSLTFKNCRNGIYVFSVRAIDETGNAGESESVVLVVNKYSPHTVISGLQTKKDEFGNLSVNIFGQDFDYEGLVDQIIVEKSGEPQFKKTFYLSKNDYKISSSNLITNLHLEELEEGNYKIFVHHSRRGTSGGENAESNKFKIDESGTVKIERPFVPSAEWKSYSSEKQYSVQVVDLLFILLAIFCVLSVVFAIYGIASALRESVFIHSEVAALLTGDVMPLSKKIKVEKLKKRQTSLKLKLVGFTVLLVISIVIMVSASLGRRMIQTQRKTLVESMQEQVIVLLEGMSNSVQNAMNDAVEGGSSVGLIDLVRQTNNFGPAIYSTVIGRGKSAGSSSLDFFWASTENTAAISQKLDTAEPLIGKSRFKSETVESKIALQCAPLEETAHQKVDDILKDISEKYSREKKDEYTAILRSISRSATQSVPVFNENSLAQNNLIYTFYYPVFYKNNNSQNLLHAVLVLQVSAEELISSLSHSRNTIIIVACVVAFVAMLLGIIGSWFLASLIVEPLKKLMAHVKVITETKDKKKLKNFTISIKSHDEIGTLGDAVNEMTSGLVQAAEEEEKSLEQKKLSLDAKAVQQTFLPLSLAEKGGKKTTAEEKEKTFQLFGYYEGTDDVSGDYFDYKKLDDRFYAVIKCDVSGHGVPAALIMTVVATLFRKYFEQWTFKTHGTALGKLVVQINDFIESLGVKGKFATLLIALFDSKNGDVHLCNAGDNIIHIFSSKEKTIKTLALHESPAAGPLPSFMVEMKGGFVVEKIHLNPDDVLFLYTDGIEESTRFFRTEDFKVTECREPDLNNDGIHKNHKIGQTSEQVEYERVKEILESVLNRKVYRLTKYHSPTPDEELIFDFTKLEGNIDEAIMALVAVEKVFRMYKTPQSKGSAEQNEKGGISVQGDVVRVDRKIDAFLKKTFSRYSYYCSSVADLQEPNYIYYQNLNEDPQADDLTLLALKKL